MACKYCMDYKPWPIKEDQFTCPKCGQGWKLANVWPGQYWEPIETHKADQAKVKKVIKEIDSEI